MSDGISFRNRLGTSRERKPVWFSFFFNSFAFVDNLCYNKSIRKGVFDGESEEKTTT